MEEGDILKKLKTVYTSLPSLRHLTAATKQKLAQVKNHFTSLLYSSISNPVNLCI